MGRSFNQYSIPEDGFIGEGRFSVVYQVIVAKSGCTRAMKVIDSDTTVVNELAVLIRLEHASSNVVKYYDHFEVNARGETDLVCA